MAWGLYLSVWHGMVWYVVGFLCSVEGRVVYGTWDTYVEEGVELFCVCSRLNGW